MAVIPQINLYRRKLPQPRYNCNQHFELASSYGSTFKIPSINDGLNLNLKRGAKSQIVITIKDFRLHTGAYIRLLNRYYEKSSVKIFIKQNSICSCSELSIEILYTTIAQVATRLTEIKI